MLGSIVGAVKWVGRAVSGVTDLVKRFTTSKEQQLGRLQAERDQQEEVQDARERMDGDKPDSERSTARKLRDGRF